MTKAPEVSGGWRGGGDGCGMFTVSKTSLSFETYGLNVMIGWVIVVGCDGCEM